MEEINFTIEQIFIRQYNSIIIGSGAAGLNCALHLLMEGIAPNKIAIVTDKLGGGTSFNTGSDKQTYYKMSIIGDQLDSPMEMAESFFSGGAMHGDIALIETTNSIREFFHLVQLGVPFPHDEFGGFVGYKTDNDPRQRATSIGPLTSQKMGKCLLEEVNKSGIKIFDKYFATKIITDGEKEKKKAIGLICLNINTLSDDKNIENIKKSIEIFKAKNIIIATGGPALLYKHSVYPPSQKGTLSLAIEAGCKLQNLTESQFGLASIKFRWNVSGSYQQVIPRYISIDKEGKEREFLSELFPSFRKLSRAIFLKGYQWPFNSERIKNYGSSLIDLAVYYETEVLGHRVYIDFMKNPKGFNFNDLNIDAKNYLTNSNALGETPLFRLKQLNERAITIYKEHGIDLNSESLEIAVCNQHLNGGISGNIWWESNNVKNIFAIGEINGSHGIHRPGGAALNSGQVGGLRAAQKIAHYYKDENTIDDSINQDKVKSLISTIILEYKEVINDSPPKEQSISPNQFLQNLQDRMSKFAAIIRPQKGLEDEIRNIQDQINNISKLIKVKNNHDIIKYFRVKDALLTQYLFLNSINDYHISNGRSRGSYLIIRDYLNESLSEIYITSPGDLNQFKFIQSKNYLSDKIQTIKMNDSGVIINWEDVRYVPSEFGWFENVWKEYNDGDIFK